MTDAEFLAIFQDEASERLDNIVETLLALEGGNARPDAVGSLFRDAHTIKGAAGMLGLDDVRALAHALEEVLAGARESGSVPPELIDPLLRAADALRARIAGGAEPTADLLDELAASRAGLHGAAAADPAEPELESEPEPKAPQERAARGGAAGRAVRVPTEKIDQLLDLVGETVLHRRRLEYTLGTELDGRQAVADELGLGERLLDDLKDAAIGMRTLPLSSIAGGFPRAVRDLAAAEGKKVELVLVGAETELDRVILESLSDPLVHLLRNAVAHGIEKPSARKRAGKPQTGRLQLRAEQRGGLVEITIADDGRGVPADVLEQARREGSLVDVLTRPGYSTAEEVTHLAGRGVGLDAVKAHVEVFGGSLEITSEPGAGTAIVLLLPLTLALLDVLLFERGAAVFGLALPAVEEAVAVDDTLTLEGRPALELRGRSLPLFDLAELLGAAAPPLPAGAPALVVLAAGRRVAVACDLLLGQEEVVVKPLGPLLSHVPGYLGAAILGDGRIALLLDAGSLTRGPLRPTAPSSPAPALAERPSGPGKVLVVEDSFTVRELQRSILEAAGYRVETARHGGEALERLAQEPEVGLVLTDIEMPEMDGLELITAIRADPERSSLPVVVVTTRGGDEDRRLGIEAGADAYMAKRGFDQQALLETVERLIGR